MMINCTECGKAYSDQAKACIHCGARNPASTGGGCLKAVIGLVVMVVLFAIFVVAIRMYTFDPKEASEKEMIMACRDALNDTANGIETRQTLREACDSWEQKFREKYGHGPY
jgi:hypothetical protein